MTLLRNEAHFRWWRQNYMYM